MGRPVQVYEIAEKLRDAFAGGGAMTMRELQVTAGKNNVRGALVKLMQAGEVIKISTRSRKVAHHYIKTEQLGKTSLRPCLIPQIKETPAGVLMLQTLVTGIDIASQPGTQGVA